MPLDGNGLSLIIVSAPGNERIPASWFSSYTKSVRFLSTLSGWRGTYARVDNRSSHQKVYFQ